MTADFTFDELCPFGWHPHWLPQGDDVQPFVLEFTFYRSEIARHSLVAHGRTEQEARNEAVRQANEWLQAHPEFAPRRRPAVSDEQE